MSKIIELLNATVSRFPEKTAICKNGVGYSFQDLFERSARLAGSIDCNYKRSPIAVFVERDIDTLVCFLAVILSGNYYVPIDPLMPTERIQIILDEIDPGYVFFNGSSSPQDLKFSGKTLSAFHFSANTPLFYDISDDDPLYLIYTSGSTGKPKGVLKSHRSVASFLEAYCETFSISSNDIIGNQTPFYFDASAKDFYLMLKTGATLDIVPSEKFAMPTELINYLNDHKITFISWVPTALAIVSKLRIFSYVKPLYLKKVFFVGEVMPTKHLNYWIKNIPDAEYVNLYGQSEIAGISCWFRVCKEYPENERLPIGKPLCNCRTYLVNDQKVITSSEEVGEIYLVSDALALGYYLDKQKTDDSFIYKDFGRGPERAFRTGDLAYYNADQDLIFSSRNDCQIKHRGYRIELGEIETVCDSFPELQRNCCLYDEKRGMIVLFTEPLEFGRIDAGYIKNLLRGRLSDYMQPNKIIIIKEMPISANGKINRTVLKEML